MLNLIAYASALVMPLPIEAAGPELSAVTGVRQPSEASAAAGAAGAPAITNQPQTQIVTVSGTASFTGGATGTAPLAYQWRRNGFSVPGANGPTLTLNNIGISDAGTYTVLVTNASGMALSQSAILTVSRSLPAVADSAVAWFGARYVDGPMLPSDWANVIAVASKGGYRLALKSDGTVVGENGPNGLIPIPDGLSNVVAIAAGDTFGLALRKDGTVVGWGGNEYGQISIPAGLSGVVAISANRFYSLALKSDGTVVAWGENDQGQANPPPGLSRVVATSAGPWHSLALKADGTVVAWGLNWWGGATVPASLSNVVSVAAGYGASVALRSDGTVVAWGGNDAGWTDPPADLRDVFAVSAGWSHGLALKRDGTVVGWGDMQPRENYDFGEPPALVPPGLQDVRAIEAGIRYSVVLLGGSPVIATQPGPQFVTEGGTSDFYINAYGPAPLSYHWFREGLPVEGGTNALLVISNTLPAHAGSYHVVVTNAHGAATSQTVALTLNTGMPGAVDLSFNSEVRFEPMAYLVKCMALQPDGKVVLGGWVTLNGQRGVKVVRLDPDGSLDPTFAAGSPADTAGGPLVFALALQPDGKILVAGQFTNFNGTARYHLARLNADGSLDATFLNTGTGPNRHVWTVRPQSDGKVLIGGAFTEFNGVPRGLIARLNADGTLDTTFLATGSGLEGDESREAQCLALQPNGRILVAGRFATANGVPRNGLARLNADGTTDTGFQPVIGSTDGWGDVLVEPDGKLLVGNRGMYRDGGRMVFLARLNSDGSLDPTFDTASGPNGPVSVIARQPDRKLVIGGAFSKCGGLPHWGIARLRPDGQVDTGFVEGGRPTQFQHHAYDVELAPDGQIVVSGDFTSMSGHTRVGVAKLLGGELPSISVAPRGQTVYAGSTPVLSVAASGQQPLAYRWQHNGVDILGATNGSLFLLGAETNAAGTYTVAVSAPAGATVRASATLTIKPVPEDATAGYFGSRYLDNSMISPDWTNVIAIAGTNWKLFAVRPDGTLLHAGGPSAPELSPPPGLSNVVAVAVGIEHVLALKRDGTIVSWGGNANGQRDPPSGLKDVVAIACSPWHSLALKSDGSVVGWGANDSGQATPPAGLTGVVAISAGSGHNLALKADGTVVGWGYDGYGQATVPAGLSNVVSVAACHNWSMALRDDGTVVAWGDNEFGQCNPPSGLTGITAISAGPWHGLALKSDGTVIGWGDMRPPENINYGEPLAWVPPGLKDVISIVAGFAGNLVLIVGPPVIPTQPGLQFVTEGGTSDFHVNAYGPAPLSYQWFHEELPVEGGTNALLVISNTLPAQAGSYHVLVTNAHGMVTSQSALLTLNTGEPGAVDLSFSSEVPFEPMTSWPKCMVVQPDGKIVLGGWVTLNGQRSVKVVRLNSDGSLDQTFTAGNPTDSTGGPFVYALALQPDGKILVAGQFTNLNGVARNHLARLNSDGSLDATYLNTGTGPNRHVRIVALQPDGKVLIGGAFTEFNGVPRGLVARLNAEGTLDTMFLATGSGLEGDESGEVECLAVQSDGKTFVAGRFTTANGVPRGGLARLNADGTTDTAFTPVVSSYGGWRVVLPETDGRLLIGHGGIGVSGGTLFLARLNSDGSLDPSFDTANGPNGGVFAIRRQPDGRLLIGGQFSQCGGLPRWGIARLLPDGKVDTTFVEGGRPTLFHHQVYDVELAPDGRIVVSGNFASMSGHERAGIARLYQGTLPTIVSQPVSQRIVVGNPVTLSVTATNPARLYYQWQRNGVDLSGATNTSLSIPSVQPVDGGGFTVVVRDSTGSVTSQSAVLTPVVRPSVATDLANQIVHFGADPALAITLNGTPPFNYQWRFNDVNLPGATNATLVLNDVRDGNSGSYSVVVGNEAGSVTNQPALLQVYYGSGHAYRWLYPDIPGGNVSDLTGDPSFPLFPSGIEKLTNGLASGVNMSEAYGSYIQGYLIPPKTGNYTFWIAADESAEFWLSTNDAPANLQLLAFCLQPTAVNDWTARPEQQSLTIPLTEGQRYYFEVLHKEGTGTDHVEVGWQRPDDLFQRPIPPAYLSPLVDPVTAPAIKQQPQSLVVVAGNQALLSVAVEGVPPLRYRWQRNATDLPGATNATLLLEDVQVSHAGAYRVVITNKFGQATSDAATLAVHYALKLTILPGGTVSKDPDLTDYPPASEVTLTATPQAGHVFTGWSGDVTGTQNPVRVIFDANKTVTAGFTPVWALTLTRNIAGGEVTRTPDLAQYLDGTQVKVEAKAGAGFIFTGWTGDTNTTANPLALMMDRGRALQANFQQVFYLNASVEGSGTVTIDPQKSYYLPGESVSLTALPAAGYALANWSGDSTGTATNLTMTMNANVAVVAHFKRLVSLGVTATGQGAIKVEPKADRYLEGTSVQLTAEATTGWQFVEWKGALSGSQNPAPLTLDTNKQVEAVFRQLFTVTTDVVGHGTVTLVPKQTQYVDGTTITVVASAPSGYRFVGWSGDLTGAATPVPLLVNTNKHVIGTFLPLWALTVSSTAGGTVHKEPDLGLYLDGTAVRLNAVPDEGYAFAGWNGDASGTSNPLVCLMTTNKTIAAEFRHGWTLTVTTTEGGAVERSPDLTVYPGGSLVTLKAKPATGYVFVQWTGDATGTVNPLAVMMDHGKTVMANFVRAELQPPILDVAASELTPGGFKLTLSGRAGVSYVLQGSEDLGSWTDLQTLTIAGQPVTWTDAGASGKTQRFYRVRQAP